MVIICSQKNYMIHLKGLGDCLDASLAALFISNLVTACQ